ncbi:MAG: histidine--tRNA ligase [Patescibacteria group bacterium]|nr:histidine--tRNA ligase [Patescibacteria group bacterium]
MEEKINKKISTESYKGVRDFYPQDMFVQNYIFKIMRKAAESFGYSEYGASILEPSDLYRAKTGDEIVNEQTYSFKDRGDREVTLRPEMTPTVARMVAAKKREFSFPLRWYSIPNLFRYEQPQKGRLREHWQLNADIFGIEEIEAEIEIISLARAIMKEFGLKDDNYEIRVNNRKIMNYMLENFLSLSPSESHAISKIIDKKDKMSGEDFTGKVRSAVGEESDKLLNLLHSKNLEEFISLLPKKARSHQGVLEIKKLQERLTEIGIKNSVFSPTLMRGFDYYTGIVFEIFDTSLENRRAIFGGGRYDDLLNIFGAEKIPAVGFGMGDVMIRDILETYNLLPTYKPVAEIYICVLEEKYQNYANMLAQKLRADDINVAVDLSSRKIGDQIRYADKNLIPLVVCVGENEVKNEEFKVKNLKSGQESKLKAVEIAEFLKSLGS